jgi:phospholipase/lecithinase/hemolysin
LASQGGNAPDDTLYIIFIGGNDIRDMRDATDDNMARTILHTATHNIENALSQLHAAGANHFLVINSPDIGEIPETRAKALATHNYRLIERTSQKTTAYNKELAETVQETKKQKDISIVLFDLFKFFNGIVGNAKAYHFSNNKEGCLIEDTVFSTICDETKIDSFVYFDQIHPTQRVHERLGRALFAVIPEAN